MQTIINGKRPDKFERFYDSLRMRGFESYEHYLSSDLWRAFNEWYRGLKILPQACLVCGSTHFILHHWNYIRAGEEFPSDVIPLCDEHHLQLHRFLSSSDVQLHEVARQLEECFGISRRDADNLFRPTLRFSQGAMGNRCVGCRKPKLGKLSFCKKCRKEREKKTKKDVAQPAIGLVGQRQ